MKKRKNLDVWPVIVMFLLLMVSTATGRIIFVDDDGTAHFDNIQAVAWGYNRVGQCNIPSPNSGFIAIAAGAQFSLGLKVDGSLIGWGTNIYGQCDVPSPNSGFIAIAAGYVHSLGLKKDGSIVAWGNNNFDQCNIPSPNSGFTAIAGGGYHSLGLKDDGSIVAWGDNDHGQCNIPSPNSGFIAIAAGAWYSLGLKTDGSIVAWGDNDAGQCNIPSPNSGFIAIAAGGRHSLGLKEDGSIVAWGDNDFGQCNIPSPNSGFISISAGGYHSLGLKQDCFIVAWGSNFDGQCDVPSPNSSFIAISAGEYHSLALRTRIIYVDADANGLNNGSSWEDAYNFLQDALAAAASGDEIRVAQGVYTPDTNSVVPNGSGDRTATFQLINGVTIKGGYAGFGEPDPNSRDINLYKTILSGDLDGNDVDVADPCDLLTEPTRAENSYHVVTAIGVDTNSVLDGFSITGGAADGETNENKHGGGMYNYDASPVVRDCKFGANSAVGGGAIYISGDLSVTLTDCVFENNTVALGGGAIYCTSSGELSITRCEFRNGIANRGGVIYNGYASLILSECILESNQAKYAGAISTGGDITLTNCLLANNQALVYGGALDNMGSTSRSVNCTFVGNSSNYGGAIFSNIECDTIAINCIFWNNAAQTGSQIATSGDHVGSTLTVNYCDIENLLDGLYVPSGCTLNWGEDNINAEPLFADSDNGDYRLSASSPCIDAGDPNYVAEPNETDLDGKPRVIGGRIDMGAYEYSPPIPVEVRIVPRSINPASMGKWITCYIWLGEEYDVAEIDPNSVILEDEIEPEWFSVDEQEQVAMARFSRSEVQEMLEPGDMELTVSGELSDGTRFEGTDTIRVIDKGKKK